MNSKTMSIGVLSITAVILFVAQFVPLQTAQAEAVWKDRDYSVFTAVSQRAGEVVYVVDNRSGRAAVFTWDAGRRTFEVGGVGVVAEAFK